MYVHPRTQREGHALTAQHSVGMYKSHQPIGCTENNSTTVKTIIRSSNRRDEFQGVHANRVSSVLTMYQYTSTTSHTSMIETSHRVGSKSGAIWSLEGRAPHTQSHGRRSDGDAMTAPPHTSSRAESPDMVARRCCSLIAPFEASEMRCRRIAKCCLRRSSCHILRTSWASENAE